MSSTLGSVDAEDLTASLQPRFLRSELLGASSLVRTATTEFILFSSFQLVAHFNRI